MKLSSGMRGSLQKWADLLFPWRADIAALKAKIAALEQSYADRLHAIEAREAAWAASCDSRFSMITARQDDQIAALEQSCADRFQALEARRAAGAEFCDNRFSAITARQDKQLAMLEQSDAVRIQRLETHDPAYVKSCEDRFSAMTARQFQLEQLLTSSPAARPPGAREAVKRLGAPAVSIILPTFNRARFIGEAISSVQAQSFRDWELVIIDDGSTDDTASVVESFAADSRIRYVRQDNAGASTARNRGIAESSAPLIAYIDSDNTWYPDFLTAAVDHLATHCDDDFVYGALVSYFHGLGSKCILWDVYERAVLETGNFIDTNVIVHRKSLVERYGGWDPELTCLNDWDIALRYTVAKPAHRLTALAAYYRKCDAIRLTDNGRFETERALIWAKLGK